MHFNVCVFIPATENVVGKVTPGYIEELVGEHIGDFNEEFGEGPGRYDWFDIGGRWANRLPSRNGYCDFCSLCDFRPFPRFGKEEKEILKRKYDLHVLPKDKVTEEKRIEAKDLGVAILSERDFMGRNVAIPSFAEFCEEQEFYFPYSYVTHDGDWVDGYDWDAPEIKSMFKSYVRGIQKKTKYRHMIVVNVDCHT